MLSYVIPNTRKYSCGLRWSARRAVSREHSHTTRDPNSHDEREEIHKRLIIRTVITVRNGKRNWCVLENVSPF